MAESKPSEPEHLSSRDILHERLVRDARDKTSIPFLENLMGVGCTLNRGYAAKLLFPKHCPLCADRLYQCLGPSCMGTRKAVSSPRQQIEFAGTVPGLPVPRKVATKQAGTRKVGNKVKEGKVLGPQDAKLAREARVCARRKARKALAYEKAEARRLKQQKNTASTNAKKERLPDGGKVYLFYFFFNFSDFKIIFSSSADLVPLSILQRKSGGSC